MQSKIKLFGHPVHPMLVVFPLGLFVTAVLFDILYLIGNDPALPSISYYLIGAGLLVGAVAAVFGIIDWLGLPYNSRAWNLGLMHGIGNIFVLGLFLLSWLRRGRDLLPNTATLTISFIAIGIVLATAWLGGELVYRLGVGVDRGAHLDAPSSLKNEPASTQRQAASRSLPPTGKPYMGNSRLRLLLGISIFWLPLSALFDGLNTLVLPLQVGNLASQTGQATVLGLLTFIGLLAGALVQPVAGLLSDRLRPRLGRKGFIGIGLLLSLGSLSVFALAQSLPGLLLGYLGVQVSASIAQAGQQGLLPDLVGEQRRGLASGMKGFMDLAGAMLGFVLLGQLLGSGSILPAVGILAALLVTAYLLAVLLTPEDAPHPGAAARDHLRSLSHAFRLDLTQQSAFVRLVIARFLFLLGIYGTGRFLLFFVANRLGLSEEQAAGQAGSLLAGLALVTVLASPVAGWLADRAGRMPLMVAGAILSAVSALMLVWADHAGQILLFGGLMSLGSAAFSGGSWALLADLVPKDQSARFFGLANFSTAGAAAAAGLFGPAIDWGETLSPGAGYAVLFILASIAFLSSAIPLKGLSLREHGDIHENENQVRPHAARLAVVPVQTDPADVEKDRDPPGRDTRL